LAEKIILVSSEGKASVVNIIIRCCDFELRSSLAFLEANKRNLERKVAKQNTGLWSTKLMSFSTLPTVD